MAHQITKVGMIILLQPDLKEAVEFYQTLSLQLKFHLRDQWAEFKLGEVKIGLCPTSQPAQDHRTGVVFEVEDLHKTHEALKDTVTFVGEPIERVHGIMIGIKDPGGNIIDLYQPTPEKVAELAQKKAGEPCCKETGGPCKCKSSGCAQESCKA